MSDYGDLEQELADFYKSHLGALVVFLDRATGDEEASNDLAHDTFEKIWKKIQAGKLNKITAALLFTTAEGVRIDWVRKNSRRQNVEEELGTQRASAELFAAFQDIKGTSPIRRIYLEVLHRLPDLQATAARYYHEYGWKMREIGEALGVTDSYVSRLLKAANEELVKEFMRRGIKSQ